MRSTLSVLRSRRGSQDANLKDTSTRASSPSGLKRESGNGSPNPNPKKGSLQSSGSKIKTEHLNSSRSSVSSTATVKEDDGLVMRQAPKRKGRPTKPTSQQVKRTSRSTLTRTASPIPEEPQKA